MSAIRQVLSLHRLVGVLLIAVAGFLVYVPKPSKSQLKALAEHFAFVPTELDVEAFDAVPREPLFTERLQHFEIYLNAFIPLGASLADLNRDGRPNELCVTNAKRRLIRVMPVDGPTFPAFSLRVPNLRRSIPTGCLPGDFNRDGVMDLLVYFWGRTPIIYQAVPSADGRLDPGHFRPVEIVEPPETWYTHSVTSNDVDGDGQLDLIIANYFHESAKVVDRTGDPGEAYMHKGFGNATNGAYNRLLLGAKPSSGNARYVDASEVFRQPDMTQWTIAIGSVDMDDDGRPEIWFINDHGADRLYHNRSKPGAPRFTLVKNPRTFTEPKSISLGQDDFHGMGLDFGDINNDGLIDAVVTNFGANFTFHQSHYYWLNTGQFERFAADQAPFRDIGESLGTSRTDGVPWDVRVGDFNNDSYPEFIKAVGFVRGSQKNKVTEFHEVALMNDYAMQFPEAWHKFHPGDDIAGNYPNAFFARSAIGKYYDIGHELGLWETSLTRGISTADVDADGRLDFAVSNQNSSPKIYMNQAPNAGRFLGLNIRLTYAPTDPSEVVVTPGMQPPSAGPPSGPAVGTKVVIALPNGRKSVAFIDGGTGAGGKKVGFVHFGLGSVARNESVGVELSWRASDGTYLRQQTTLRPGWHTIWLGARNEQAGAR